MIKTWMRRAVVAIALAAPLSFGCRAVLGIGDYELTDAGADANVDPFSCEAYCDTIMAKCMGNDLQYENASVCRGYCESIPRGTASDQSGNTLGCRLTALAQTGELDCVAAGPTGDGVCGSSCPDFCASAVVVCPNEVPDEATCEATLCAPDCGNYRSSETKPLDPTLGCRIWHLAAAAEGRSPDASAYTQNQTVHCQHVAGLSECVIDAGAIEAGAEICAALDGGP